MIGDSVTDLKMALAGDVVFARDRLAQYLGDRDVPYHPWENFGDIQKVLDAEARFSISRWSHL